jgi:phosphatidate cytidylyltransferase
MIIGEQTLFAMALLYLTLALASAGVMLKTPASPPGQLRQQITSWWRIFPLVSLSLLTYPAGPALLVLLVGMLALLELGALLPARTRCWPLSCGIGLTLLLLAGRLWPAPALAASALGLPLAAAGLLLLAPPAGGGVGLRPARLALFLTLLYGLACCGLMFVTGFRQLPMPAQAQLNWLFYLFVLTALNDIGQFVVGKWLGKQKIATRISPNKTWQGLAGGVALSLLLSLSLGRYLHLAGTVHLLGFGLLLSLGGFGGDLLFSAAKRRLGLKDFSRLIPGHGGILDRVDSLVLTAPLLYLSLRFTL